MLIDFHTHIDQYSDAQLEQSLADIRAEQIFTVAASTDIVSWKRNCAIAARARDMIVPTFGVHPSYCAHLPQTEGELVTLLEPYLLASPFIGEIGLDFFWEKTISPAVQERVLCVCLDHCERTQKYAVLHTKGAEERLLALLRDFPHAKPIIHWYDGSTETLRRYLDRGYPQTFGCELRYSEHTRALLALTPLDLILSETDNPTGEPWLGGTDNSPRLIRRVIHDMARVTGVSPETMEATVEQNARRIFETAGIVCSPNATAEKSPCSNTKLSI